ncbi:MAG: RdgB/HAM1 family non-canonical purine NTP pyrophosphatase [Acidobacteria bacterium]|nr:MAG: RdgB/HAM1 family non-canonical purine NTP pyrophosphatase [Acidobacteriota bacterium]
MTIYLATGNPGKVADFHGIGLPLEMLPNFASLPSIAETGATFEANARLKAEHYSRFTTAMVLADDSGLEVDALQGAPGVYSARFAGKHGDDVANNRLLLQKLEGIPQPQRSARFVCVLALAQLGRPIATFCGTAEGRILDAPRGDGGFGYDPLFYSPATGASFAELPPDRKAQLSHRGAAARAMLEWIGAQQAHKS